MFPAIAIGLLAAAPALVILSHQFVYDDLLIIRDNQTVHALAAPWRFFAMPYWPPQFIGGMYRPASILLFAVQWAGGGGSPVVFHAVSIALYAALALAVYRLARLLLPPGAAWAAAAIFAVHPVHTEVVAAAVNQSELLVALLLVVAATVYIARRRAGSFGGGAAAGVLFLYAAAALTKETALILPGFLLAAEIFLVSPSERGWARIRRLRPFYLGMVLVAVSLLAIRGAVLQGGVFEAYAADALAGQGLATRLLTMLGVVPEWGRLLLWPAHLQVEYSPLEIETARAFGTEQLAGALLLALLAAVAWSARKRLPVVTFAVVWMAVALAPVHNVFIVTGIVLAERTLLLASVGAVLLLGAGVAWGFARLASAPGASGLVPALVVGALLALGTWQTVDRYPVWRDQATLLRRSIVDAPLSYRAHYAYGDLLARQGRRHEAETEYLTAIGLFSPEMRSGSVLARRSTRVYQSLGDLYRNAGLCEPAVKAYQSGLKFSASVQFNDVRQSMIACLLYLGDYHAAAAEARIGVAGGWNAPRFRRYLALADSARTAGAPPGTVRIPDQ